jgi:HD-like signal output (HDOD) protein
MPELHLRITEELKSSDSSLELVGTLIGRDPVMTAKILQVVNSAYFGLPTEITNSAEAVLFLGTERTRSLILLAGVFSEYDRSSCFTFRPEELWRHSAQVGSYARTIALMETRNSQMAETAFTAGLLHDVGKLFLAGNVPDLYAAFLELEIIEPATRHQTEREALGTTHAELGACVLGTWGLPLPILEAVAWHHEPDRSEDVQFSLVTAVHVANHFAHFAAGDPKGHHGQLILNLDYLARIGAADCLPRWQEQCGIPAETAK